MPRRRAFLAGVAAAGICALAGCSGSLDAEENVTREYDLNGATTVRTETTNGDIEVRARDRETVRVEGTKRATDQQGLDDVSLDTTNDGDARSIVVESDVDPSTLATPPQIDLTLTVPSALSVDAASTNGDITAELNAPESVTAETTNGDVDLSCERAGSVDVFTENGDVGLSCETAVETDIETANGEVTVQFPPEAELALDLDTRNGEITVGEFETGTVAAGSSVEVDIGSGTTELEAETTNGDITVEPG